MDQREPRPWAKQGHRSFVTVEAIWEAVSQWMPHEEAQVVGQLEPRPWVRQDPGPSRATEAVAQEKRMELWARQAWARQGQKTVSQWLPYEKPQRWARVSPDPEPGRATEAVSQ